MRSFWNTGAKADMEIARQRLDAIQSIARAGAATVERLEIVAKRCKLEIETPAIRLECLKLAGGDTGKAEEMFRFVTQEGECRNVKDKLPVPNSLYPWDGK